MENNIGKEAWKNHFKELLEGNECKEEVSRGREEGKKGEREEELQEKEIWEVLKRMKKNKAVGADGLPMEVWKYAGSDLRKGLAKLMNLMWKEGRMPEDWRKSVIVPIYKRGDPNLPSNYRGISLLCSAYKIYAELIRKRIEEQAKRKGCLPDTQFGFRKKKSTMDNIFILSHLVQRGRSTEEMEKNKRVYAFFADLKAAFDNVDRGILWRILREMDLDEGMIRRLELIYEKTEVMVRTEAGLTESFVTRRGVRQGCVLSPLLFNLYMAGISEALKIRKIGGIEVGCERIWELAYADDLVLLARNKEAFEDMLGTFRLFLKERKLELNVDKSKVMVFNRKKNERKEVWRWKGKDVEEVQSFKYLGFTLSREGDYREHIKELVRKGRLAVRKVWGLGERVCRNDFIRRWTFFKYSVQSVISYGVEIWGWVEREELERIMCDYVRWLFNIDFCTPRYIIYREIGLEKLRIGWGIRAWRFEGRCKRDGGKIIKECWKEKEERDWIDLYGRERMCFWRRCGGYGGEGMGTEGDQTKREEEVMLNEREKIKEEGTFRIERARYNSRYKELLVDGKIPRYLERKNLENMTRGEGVRALTRLRCGNLENWNKFWLGEEERKCSFCGEGRDNMEHFVEVCEETKEWFKELGENREEIWKRIWSEDFDEEKGEILVKLWKSKAKKARVRGVIERRGQGIEPREEEERAA